MSRPPAAAEGRRSNIQTRGLGRHAASGRDHPGCGRLARGDDRLRPPRARWRRRRSPPPRRGTPTAGLTTTTVDPGAAPEPSTRSRSNRSLPSGRRPPAVEEAVAEEAVTRQPAADEAVVDERRRQPAADAEVTDEAADDEPAAAAAEEPAPTGTPADTVETRSSPRRPKTHPPPRNAAPVFAAESADQYANAWRGRRPACQSLTEAVARPSWS